VSAEGPVEVWARPLADGSKAVGLFNRHAQPMEIRVSFRQFGFSGPVQVRDVWSGNSLGTIQDDYQARVPAHGVVLLRVSK
jgi:alpha-galactosidase